MDSKGTPRLYAVVAIALAAAGIGILAFRVLRPFMAAIAWAVILAIAFRRPWRWLEGHMPRHRSLASMMLALGIGLLVLLPAGLFAAALAAEAAQVATGVSAALKAQHVASFGDIVRIPLVASTLDNVQARMGVTPEELNRLVTTFVSRTSTFLAKAGGQLLLSGFDGVLTFMNAIFILFFLFRDGHSIARRAGGLLPVDENRRRELAMSVRSMVEGIFRGSLLCALVQGVSGGIGWWIAGLGSPALAGAAMAVLSLIPIGGTAFVWLPGAIWLWATGHVGGAIFLFLWGSIVTAFLADNLLRPILLRGAQQFSTLTVFLGVFGGIAAFGLLGVFLGPIVLALGITVMDVLRALTGAVPSATEAEPA